MDTPTLDIERAHRAMHAWPVGHMVRYVPCIASTMDLGQEVLADHRLPSGVVCVTEEQSAGRGRLARSWQAPFGTGLLLTVVLKAPALPETLGVAPMLVGVAILDAITELCPQLDEQLALKWPNDVLILQDGQPQKVAGVLAESVWQGGALVGLLLGMGINVNQQGAQLPPAATSTHAPTSLRLSVGHPVDRTELLIALCGALGRRLADDAGLFATWRERLHTLGQPVTVTQPDGERVATGTAVDVLADGSLVVEERGGTRVTVATGDVSLRA
jgi:BirA family biotin operon repressor/biotin-[acetyl-CoA-carboxylase] ligase